MVRRVFGRHEYARRRLMGWPIYSPRWVAGKPKPGLSGHLPQHSAPRVGGIVTPPPKKRRVSFLGVAERTWSPFKMWGR